MRIRPGDCKLAVNGIVETEACDLVSHLRLVQAFKFHEGVTDLWPMAPAW